MAHLFINYLTLLTTFKPTAVWDGIAVPSIVTFPSGFYNWGRACGLLCRWHIQTVSLMRDSCAKG